MLRPDGSTFRADLESIRRQTGQTPPELEPVECPSEVKYIWDHWLSMEKRRQGQNPISWEGVESWARLRGIDLTAFEMDMLDLIEGLYFKEVRKMREAK